MIPKIIHYCWFGGGPKPDSVLRCIESWKQYCPDYEVREWNESNLDIHMNLYTEQAYENKKWGFVPDYLRLWIVYTYGGLYFDTDVEAIRSFDALLQYPAFAGFEAGSESAEGAFVALGLGFGAEKGNPFLLEHMRLYDGLRFINEDGSLNTMASPKYTTKLLDPMGLDRKSNTIQKLGDIVILPTDYLCPKRFETGSIVLTSNTYSIHHFSASWLNSDAHAMLLKRWAFYEKRRKTKSFRRKSRGLSEAEAEGLLKQLWQKKLAREKKRKQRVHRIKVFARKIVGNRTVEFIKKILHK